MIHWLFNYLLRRGFKSRREIIRLGRLEELARSGTGAWALTQEKARLEYLAAKECFDKTRSGPDFERVIISLLQLTSTNAVVQALINEHMLELLPAKPSSQNEPNARRDSPDSARRGSPDPAASARRGSPDPAAPGVRRSA
jgi:hypothetical protein